MMTDGNVTEKCAGRKRNGQIKKGYKLGKRGSCPRKS